MRLDLESTPTTLPVFQSSSDPNGDVLYSADRLLKRGVTAAQNGDRDEARKYLTQVVALDPECADAWMWLASISDYPEELLAFLNRVLALDPENARAVEWRAATMSLMAKTFVKRAITAHNAGDHELAEQSIEQALAHDEDCADAWAWKASIANDDDQQMSLLHRALEIDPDHAEALEAVRQIEERREEEARLAAEAARLEEERRAEEQRQAEEEARLEAERRAEQEREAEESRVAALFGDAKAAAIGGHNTNAVELVDEYLEHRPENVDAWIFRSHVSPGVDQKMDSLAKALAIQPDHVAARAAYDFLASMAAPVARPAEAPGEVAAAEAVTAESITHVNEYLEEPVAAPIVERSFDAPEYDPYETVSFVAPAEPEPPVFELSIENTVVPDPPFEAVASEQAAGAPCPFCGASGQASAFECHNCNAVLSLSDLEAVLANDSVDRDAVSRAVIRMEGEWNARDFNVEELTQLSLGHLNLGSYDAGRKYLQEALSLDPNNVVLASQLNALAIRLDEIERQREIEGSRPKGKTILVVDDSATVRKLISGKLEKSGHNVISACDGIEALERISEHVPDLVLLDITMPRMDGYEVCKQIRASRNAAHVPVVMISGKDGFFDKVRGRMAGTTGYVTKPFGPETLMKALETYLLPDEHSSEFVAEYEAELEPVV